MALVNCTECGKEISSSAGSCPNCGKRRGSSPVAKIFLAAVGIVALLLIIGLANAPSGGTYAANEICDQSAEAGHYIASLSASSSDVVRVTDQVIAERRYPELGDKVVASIGAVVATSRGLKTPDEIADLLRQQCHR